MRANPGHGRAPAVGPFRRAFIGPGRRGIARRLHRGVWRKAEPHGWHCQAPVRLKRGPNRCGSHRFGPHGLPRLHSGGRCRRWTGRRHGCRLERPGSIRRPIRRSTSKARLCRSKRRILPAGEIRLRHASLLQDRGNLGPWNAHGRRVCVIGADEPVRGVVLDPGRVPRGAIWEIFLLAGEDRRQRLALRCGRPPPILGGRVFRMRHDRRPGRSDVRLFGRGHSRRRFGLWPRESGSLDRGRHVGGGPPDVRALAAADTPARRLDRLIELVAGVTGRTDEYHGLAVRGAFMEGPSGQPPRTTIEHNDGRNGDTDGIFCRCSDPTIQGSP